MQSEAATLTWDTVSGDGATITPGSGTWNTTAGNTIWNNAGANVPWSQTSATVATNAAVFGGGGGPHLITVGTAVAAQNIAFTGGEYSFSAPSAVTITTTTTTTTPSTAPQLRIDAGAIVNVGANVTINQNAAGTMFIGAIGGATGGTLNINSGGIVQNTVSNTIGIDGSVVNVNSGGTLRGNGANSSVALGQSGTGSALSTLNINGGAVSVTGTGTITVGNNTGTTGILNLNGGTLTTTTTSANGLSLGSGNANTSGTVNLNGGVATVRLVRKGATGIGAVFNFNGGTLRPNIDNATFMEGLTNAFVKSGGAFIDTQSFNITVNQSLLTDAVSLGGGFTKSGNGTLTLGGSNTYTGATAINAGTLVVNGSLSSSSMVSIAGGATLSGVGSVGGGVTTVSGSIISPATATTAGVLSVGSLTLNPGASVNYEFGASSDLVNVTSAAGLTLNGGAVNLFASGGASPLMTNGTYTLFDYSGSFNGSLTNLTVGNSQVGKFYALVNDATNTTISISIGDAVVSVWNGASNNQWNTSGNWVNGTVPNTAGAVAQFGNIPTALSVVAVGGPKTVGGIVFDNSNGYVLTGGSSDTVTLSNGISAAGISAISGNHNVAAPVILATSTNLSAAAGTVLTISGDISGSNGLAAAGAGTIVLQGSNSYTTTTVNSGATLNVGGNGNTGTLGTGDMTVATGGTLALSRSDNVTVNNNILGPTGILVASGSGTTTLTGANTIGNLAVNSGTVTLGSASALPSGVALSMSGGTLDLNGRSLRVASLSGSGGSLSDLSAGPGTSVLTADISANQIFGGSIVNGATRTLALTKSGLGALSLAAANSYTGITTITNGALLPANPTGVSVPGNVVLGDGTNMVFLIAGAGAQQFAQSSVLTFANGTQNAKFQLRGSNQALGGIDGTSSQDLSIIQNDETGTPLYSSPAAAATLTIDAVSNHSFFGIIRERPGQGLLSLTKNGAGTQELINNPSTAGITYQGATTVNEGVLRLKLSGATAGLFASPTTVNSSGTLQLDGNWTMSPAIDGTGVIEKVGTGTVQLAAASDSFFGTTKVTAGTLLVNGSLSANTVTVESGGTLGGSGIVGAVDVFGGSISPGNSPGTLTTGSLSLDSSSVVSFELASGNVTVGGGINDLALVNGGLTLDGTLQITTLGGDLVNGDVYTLLDYSGTLVNNGLLIDNTFMAAHPGASIVIDSDNSRVLLVVPEPSSATVILGGLGLLLGCMRRRRRSSLGNC
jgi:fibronectin-binding autotransporter adhesin